MSTYYADYKNGDDTTGNGSSALPWKTLSKSLVSCSDGDTIKLRGDNSQAALFREAAIVSARNNITITADAGHTPTLSEATLYTPWLPTGGTANVYETVYTAALCYHVWNGVVPCTSVANVAACDALTNSYFWDDPGNVLYVNIGGDAPTALDVNDKYFDVYRLSGANVALSNLSLRFCYGHGFRLDGQNATVTNCIAEYGSAFGVTLSGATFTGCIMRHNGFGAGVDVLAGASSVTIRNCDISDWGSYGINIADGTGHVVDGCTIRNCINGINVSGGSVTISNCTGIDNTHSQFQFNGSTTNVTIHHCLGYITADIPGSIGTNGFVIEDGATASLYHCVAAYAKRDSESNRVGFYTLIAGATSVLRNCIAYQCRYGFSQDLGTCDIDYCCAYGNTTDYSAPAGAHDVTGDPLFANTAAGSEDFHLLASSPCIDKGVYIAGINDGYVGIAPDIGCYEFAFGVPSMTVVPSQHGLINEGWNAVRLAKYAQLTQMEGAFWGVLDPDEPVDEACSPILTLPEREQIARYLGEAQDEIEQVIGYPLTPRWFVDELPYSCTVHAKRKKLIEPGIMATENVSLGAALNDLTDPETIGPLATTVTDADEIHIYHPGTDIEIDPSSVTIAAGLLTIGIPRCRLVNLAHVDNPQAGLDYTDDANFETTVDIKRIYNDPYTQATLVWPHMTSESCNCPCICLVCGEYTHEACAYVRNGETGAVDVLYAHLIGSVWTSSCTCVCSKPELVRIYYRAGLVPLTKQAEDAIIHLAHAKMPRPSCGCGILRDKWDADRVVPDNMTAEQAGCPFGQSVGAFIAWKFANAMKIYRAGIL